MIYAVFKFGFLSLVFKELILQENVCCDFLKEPIAYNKKCSSKSFKPFVGTSLQNLSTNLFILDVMSVEKAMKLSAFVRLIYIDLRK